MSDLTHSSFREQDGARSCDKVSVDRIHNRFQLRCGCEVGRQRRLCSHKLGVVLGEAAPFAGSREQLTSLLEIISLTPIPDAARQLVHLKAEREFLNQEIENQVEFLNALLEDVEVS